MTDGQSECCEWNGPFEKEEPKKESRSRCRKCGGPLRVGGTYSKGPYIKIRYRICLACGAKHRSTERIELDEDQ